MQVSNSTQFFFFLSFFFFGRQGLPVAPADLELLSSIPQRSARLCLLIAGIKGVCHHAWLWHTVVKIITYYISCTMWFFVFLSCAPYWSEIKFCSLRFFFFFFGLFNLFETRSPYSSGCPLIHYVDQAGFEITEICLPLSPSAGTKGVCHHAGP